MDLKNIIEQSLHIPVIDLSKPVHPPCVTYYPLTEEAALTGDGEETETVEGYQVDIWDQQRETVKERTKKLKVDLQKSIATGMSIPETLYQFDANGKLWRATIVLNVLREE